MTAYIHAPVNHPRRGHTTVDLLLAALVHAVLAPDWAPDAAGHTLFTTAHGNTELLRRARVRFLRTESPRSMVRCRALLTLAAALALSAEPPVTD